MKKLVLAILMIAVAMPAFASETRVRALGPATAPYIEDDSNVFMWPATLAGYANMVTITAGYYDVVKWYDDRGWYDDEMTATFGMHYGLGEDNKYGVFGMWWKEHTYGPNYMGDWFGPGEGDFSDNIYNKWHLMWALALESIDIGIHFERADEHYLSETTDQDPFEWYTSYTTLGLGLRWNMDEGSYHDFAFDYTTVGFTYQDEGPEIIEADKKSIMALRWRWFYEWTEVITWVPYFNYKWGDLSLKSNEDGFYDTDECWGIKGSQLDLGLGTNLAVNDDNLIIVAVELYGRHKGEPSECGSGAPSYEQKMQIFPAFAFGLESDVKDWLTFRAGCDKALLKTTMTMEGDGTKMEDTWTWAPFNWYLGLGFHVSDFDIDLLLNKEVPFSMGYWLTGFRPEGGDDAGAPIGMISATYSF
jgi:hypothetical protein